MTPESIFSALAPTVLKELLNYAKQKRDDRLRENIREILREMVPPFPSHTVTVNIHIGDLVQEFHLLAQSGLSPDAILEASRSHALPQLLSNAETEVGLAVASIGPDHVECFYRGLNNHLRHRWWWNGSNWSEEHDLGGLLASAPTAVSWGPNRIDCFYRRQDNHLWHRWWDGTWNHEENLGGILTSAPAVASVGPNHLDCFYRGQDNHLWHRWGNGSGWWSEEHDLGGILTSAPAAISRKSDHIECFYRGQDTQIWHRWWDGTWNQEYWLGGLVI